MPLSTVPALRGHLVSVDRGSRLILDPSGVRTAGAEVRFTESDLFHLMTVARRAGYTVTGIDYHSDGDTFALLGDLGPRIEQLLEDRTAGDLHDLFAAHGIHLTGVDLTRDSERVLVKSDGTITAGTAFLTDVIPAWWEGANLLVAQRLGSRGRFLHLTAWRPAGMDDGADPVRLRPTDFLRIAHRAHRRGYRRVNLRTSTATPSVFPIDAELNRLVRGGRLRKALRFTRAHGAHITSIQLTDTSGRDTDLGATGTIQSLTNHVYSDLVLGWWLLDRKKPLRTLERTTA